MTRDDKLKVVAKLLLAPTPEDYEERLRLAQLMRDEAQLSSQVGRHRIEWSEEAVVKLEDGSYKSAFASGTYIARVSLKDGRVVIVVLPDGARRDGYINYIQAVLTAADAAQDGDVKVIA